MSTSRRGISAVADSRLFRLVQPAAFTPRSVGDAVYDQLLRALQQGLLTPGQRLHDSDLASQLGVSRTPVREALIRLGDLGVVEFAAARYTRVALVDRAMTRHAVGAWVAVYSAVVTEVMAAAVPVSTISAMRSAHERFVAASDPYDLAGLSVANADFYDQLTELCDNPVLIRCVDNTVHVLRLGLLHLPGPLNPEPLRRVQAALLSAVIEGDRRAARRAVLGVGAIPL